MFKNIYFFKFLIITSTIFSCVKNDHRENNIKINELSTVSDTLVIKIPDSISNPSSNLYGYWNYNDKYLGFLGNLNGNFLDLNVYNFKSNIWNKISLNIEGDNQVYSAGSFSFNEDNTINFFPIIVSKILKIDFSGKVISVKDYSKKYQHAISTLVKNQRPFEFDEKIGINTSEFLNTDFPETYKKARNYTIFDYNTNKSLHLIKYPEEFHNNGWSPNDAYGEVIPWKEKLVHSFSKSHYLYVYNTLGELERKVYAGSKSVKDAEPLKTINQDSEKSLINTENNGNYSGIIYDKWRRVFYRIATFYDTNIEVPDFKSLRSIRKYKKYIIITLNEEFEIIGEDHFSITRGIHHGIYFVNKDGLYLGLRSNNEDELNFARISF